MNVPNIFLNTLMLVMNQSNYQNQDESYNYYYVDIGKRSNITKCYGMYGCFNLDTPWTSKHRPVSLLPEELQKIDPKFPYYTRQHPTTSKLLDLDEHDIFRYTDINPNNPIYVIVHGFMEGGGIYWIGEIARELLQMEDCSVIAVDWQTGSGPPYTQAVANTRLVGAVASHLLYDLSKFTPQNKLDHLHCIGHSLGAHLCGYIGYELQKQNLTIGRITGLDPAEPHFAQASRPVRLDRSAAQYVDIIHTDASQFIRGGLGMTEKIGHVDYYPNGGNSQPGCGKSVVQYISDANGSFFLGVRKYLGCNHLRSHEYFLESLNPKSCSYTSIRCSSYEDFLAGKCFDCGKRGENCVTFGYHGRTKYNYLINNKIIKQNSTVALYLITGDKRPYCRGHYRITVKISSSLESIRHGGEVGQLFFTMHSMIDGKGPKTKQVPLNQGGYHEPGKIYMVVVPTDEIPRLKAVEVEWRYNSNVFNPLTWRLLAVPKIYIEQLTVDALEIRQSITVCPKNGTPLQNAKPMLMIASYC